MSRTKLFASLLLTTALAAPAFAADGPMQPQGWQTGVMRKDDGSFAYCISESKFSGDFAMVLALTPSGDINVGVGQKGAQLPVGSEKPVRIVIDSQPARTIHARAVKPELMVINVGQNEEFLNAVAKASTMKVDNMTFAMRGSGQAVATLRECVTSMAGSATTASAASAQAPAAPAAASASAAAAPVAAAPAAPAVEAPVQTAQAAAPAPTPAPAAAAAPAVTPKEEIRWNPSPIALPGERDAVTLPPSMQREQAQQAVAAQMAAHEALTSAAPAGEQGVAAQAPAPAPTPTPTQAPVAPALEVPAPEAPAAVVAPAPVAETPAPAAPVVAAATPVEPAIKPLPAQLETLLTTARVRDIEPAAVTSSDVAFAWKSRDMKGNVRELGVPMDSDIVQLAGQHLSQMKKTCGVTFTPSLGQPEKSGNMQILTGNAVCSGNGKSEYTTMVFALRQGVLSIVSHEIDRGRRAAPDRAQAGVVEALKGRQG